MNNLRSSESSEFMPSEDSTYTIQKADGPASGWFLNADSEKRNKNSEYVHTHNSEGGDDGDSWKILKTIYKKNTCYKIESIFGKISYTYSKSFKNVD